MFHLLGFLFIIIIAILVIGFSILGTVIRSIFGLGKRSSSNTYQNGNDPRQSDGGYSFNRQQSNSSQNEETMSEEEADQHKRKKLFSKDEGEYVDFEEIK